MTYWQPPYWLPVRTPDDDAREVKELSPRVSHVHVYEWAGAEDRRPLSDGRARWRAVLDALRAAPAPEQPAPRVAFLEFVADDDPVALLRDAQTLHELLDEPR
jgi:sugar phosphate isomerase/epimerase